MTDHFSGTAKNADPVGGIQPRFDPEIEEITWKISSTMFFAGNYLWPIHRNTIERTQNCRDSFRQKSHFPALLSISGICIHGICKKYISATSVDTRTPKTEAHSSFESFLLLLQIIDLLTHRFSVVRAIIVLSCRLWINWTLLNYTASMFSSIRLPSVLLPRTYPVYLTMRSSDRSFALAWNLTLAAEDATSAPLVLGAAGQYRTSIASELVFKIIYLQLSLSNEFQIYSQHSSHRVLPQMYAHSNPYANFYSLSLVDETLLYGSLFRLVTSSIYISTVSLAFNANSGIVNFSLSKRNDKSLVFVPAMPRDRFGL